MGGLARRAALIASKKKDGEPDTVRLFLAGPYELQDIDENKSPSATAPKIAGQAFAALGNDAIMLTPADTAVLGTDMPEALKPWVLPPGKVTSKIIERKNMRIGLVYFPVLAALEAVPTDADMETVKNEALNIRPNVDVVIGVSSWGIQGEQAFLNKFNEFPQPLDVLLGGGHGLGNRGKLVAGSATAWARPFSKGKTVNVVRLEKISNRHAESYRKHEPDVRFDLIVLDDKAPVDPGMDALLASARSGS
jgi:hypothetical protein